MGRIAVRLQPRASRSGFYGEREGVILARVSEPPLEGRANRALIALIAKRVGAAKSEIGLVSGRSSRNKVFEIEGMEPEQIREALLG